MIYILRDKDKEYEPTAIIETNTTTATEIQIVINTMKRLIDNYDEADLVTALPADCKITWINKNEMLYW